MQLSLDLSIDVLRRSPATLEALLKGLGAAWERGTEGPDTFSPFDVVGPRVPYRPVLTDHEVPRS